VAWCSWGAIAGQVAPSEIGAQQPQEVTIRLAHAGHPLAVILDGFGHGFIAEDPAQVTASGGLNVPCSAAPDSR
jgi:hypothetical protein